MISRLLYYRKKFDPEASRSFKGESEGFSVMTSDGVGLHGTVLKGNGPYSFLVVHGLLAHHRAPGIQEFSESLARYGTVASFDLRGHGISDGACTLGYLEALDVAAALVHVRSIVDTPVVLVGFSMGGAASVRCSALFEPADAVVSISGPSRWRGNRRWGALRTALMWRIPGATLLTHMLTGVRLAPKWIESPAPAEVAKKIAPAPLLVIHGDDDQFFSTEEAQDLYESADEPKSLWLIHGAGHAEGLFMDPAKEVEMQRVDVFVDEMYERFQRVADWQE